MQDRNSSQGVGGQKHRLKGQKAEADELEGEREVMYCGNETNSNQEGQKRTERGNKGD